MYVTCDTPRLSHMPHCDPYPRLAALHRRDYDAQTHCAPFSDLPVGQEGYPV